jgi:acyl carrier protein
MIELNLENLTEIIGEFVDLSGQEIHEDAVLGEDVPVDSRQMLRIVSRIEAACGLRFAPHDLLSTRTVGDLLRVAQQRAGQR